MREILRPARYVCKLRWSDDDVCEFFWIWSDPSPIGQFLKGMQYRVQTRPIGQGRCRPFYIWFVHIPDIEIGCMFKEHPDRMPAEISGWKQMMNANPVPIFGRTPVIRQADPAILSCSQRRGKRTKAARQQTLTPGRDGYNRNGWTVYIAIRQKKLGCTNS